MDRVLQDRSKPKAVRKNPLIQTTLGKLYEQRHETGDIKFRIDSEEIPAHRCVLAALSPKYKAQFYGSMSEKDVIQVEDVSPAAFKEFLQFFYLNEVTLTTENIEDVLNLAKQSLVDDDELTTECENFLLDVVGADNLVWCYRLAIDYDMKPLEEFATKQISAHTKRLLHTSDFQSCEQKILCHILDIESMNCNEVDVFHTCILWAQTKYKQDGIDDTNTANLRAALGDAFFKIRFCSMTTEQFATIHKCYSGLFSLQESSEVFRTIALEVNGEVSRIFGGINGKSRNISDCSLICSISKGSPIEFHMTQYFCDFIQFTCDKAIHLKGFIICTRVNDDVEVDITVASIRLSCKYTKFFCKNETKIILDDSIKIEKHEACNIVIRSDIFYKSNVHWYGYNVVNEIYHGGVSFQLNEKLCGGTHLITRLLYKKIDHHNRK